MSSIFNDTLDFFRYLPQSLLNDLTIIEKQLLSTDIKREIFEKAIELGYTKKDGKKFKQTIGEELFHPNFPSFECEFLEKKYTYLAIAVIIQERVRNNEILPEQLSVLDQILARYDPQLIESYLISKPEEIKTPSFSKEKWVKELKLDLIDTLQFSNDWITLYAHKDLRYSDVASPYGYEEENFITSFSNSNEQLSFQISSFELCEIPYCRTIEEFKNTKIFSIKKERLLPFLILRQNLEGFFQSNTLVKIDENFKNSAKLSWDENNILDMKDGNSTVIRYQLWALPYDGDSYSRSRTGMGVRLQIKKQFLIDYLTKFKLTLFTSCTKSRKLVQETLNEFTIKEKNEISEQQIFNPENLINLKN